MSQLLGACPQCECLLCAYGKALFQCERKTVDVSQPETWEKCLQLRRELFSHLLLHDILEARNCTVSSPVT